MESLSFTERPSVFEGWHCAKENQAPEFMWGRIDIPALRAVL
jgi:hypothetical protein